MLFLLADTCRLLFADVNGLMPAVFCILMPVCAISPHSVLSRVTGNALYFDRSWLVSMYMDKNHEHSYSSLYRDLHLFQKSKILGNGTLKGIMDLEIVLVQDFNPSTHEGEADGPL